jgi:hypothetical protein
MQILARRVAAEAVWDQSAYNQERPREPRSAARGPP